MLAIPSFTDYAYLKTNRAWRSFINMMFACCWAFVDLCAKMPSKHHQVHMHLITSLSAQWRSPSTRSTYICAPSNKSFIKSTCLAMHTTHIFLPLSLLANHYHSPCFLSQKGMIEHMQHWGLKVLVAATVYSTIGAYVACDILPSATLQLAIEQYQHERPSAR